MNAATAPRQPLPPLVVDLGHGSIAWIEGGLGFIRHAGSTSWQPITDATDIGGHVCTPAQAARIALKHGRPTP